MALIISLIIPIIILFFTGPIAVDILLVLTKREKHGAVRLFWLFLPLISAGVGINSAYTFSNFFPGPGCFLSAFTPPAAAMSFFWVRRRSIGIDNPDVRSQILRIKWVVPALQLVTLLVSFSFARRCNALNRRAAQPIITAIETYKIETGKYPSSLGLTDLDVLIPNNLPQLPSIACELPTTLQSSWYTLNDGWQLFDCGSDQGLRLLAPLISSSSKQIFNFQTGSWSIGDEFDGMCVPAQ